MPIRDEAKDPWSYVVAGLSGGFAWAFASAAAAAAGAAVPIGLGVGAAVLASKLLGGAFVRERRRLRVIGHTPEADLLERARRAQGSFRQIAASCPDGPIAERVRGFGTETTESVASMERLAGQASAVRTALAHIDPRRAAAEKDRLAGVADEALRQRALAAVQGQLDAYQRLTAALTTLLARLESGTIGLEGLVARLAEVVALAETSGTATDGLSEVDSLATELDGLRAGLVEAEAVTSRAMEGLAPGTVQGARQRSTE